MTYKEKLLNPKWQKKRLEVLNRDEFTCKYCGDTEKTLHVHHLNYIPNKEPWEYNLDDLTTLCVECHEQATVLDKEANSVIIRRLMTGLRDPFIKKCALEVFSFYNINNLIYALWELKDDPYKLESTFDVDAAYLKEPLMY